MLDIFSAISSAQSSRTPNPNEFLAKMVKEQSFWHCKFETKRFESNLYFTLFTTVHNPSAHVRLQSDSYTSSLLLFIYSLFFGDWRKKTSLSQFCFLFLWRWLHSTHHETPNELSLKKFYSCEWISQRNSTDYEKSRAATQMFIVC